MSKSNSGSLGYQMMKALQGIYQPGASWHQAKRHGRDAGLITGISTMRCMSADVHQFARFIRARWPAVKRLSEVRPEMALAYIQELEKRERSGGRIARVCDSIRKLDTACRQVGIFPANAPACCQTKTRAARAVSTRNRNRSRTPRRKPERSSPLSPRGTRWWPG